MHRRSRRDYGCTAGPVIDYTAPLGLMPTARVPSYGLHGCSCRRGRMICGSDGDYPALTLIEACVRVLGLDPTGLRAARTALCQALCHSGGAFLRRRLPAPTDSTDPMPTAVPPPPAGVARARAPASRPPAATSSCGVGARHQRIARPPARTASPSPPPSPPPPPAPPPPCRLHRRHDRPSSPAAARLMRRRRACVAARGRRGSCASPCSPRRPAPAQRTAQHCTIRTESETIHRTVGESQPLLRLFS
jgi:hypothetical protein